MSYNKTAELVIQNPEDFDPGQVFDCGQCFRWEREEDGFWYGIVGCGDKGRRTKLEYDQGTGVLQIYEDRSCEKPGADHEEDEAFWRDYFDLDRDYGAIKAALAAEDEVIAKAIEYGKGIRILRQDRWETVVSFIISQNNNIPRIKKCIRSVAELLGGEGGSMPTAEAFASLDVSDLAPCRLGYRADYLIKSASQVLEGGIPEDREGLRSLHGVGPKVASCIDLFGLGNVDSFPIDVWMKRVMNQLYGIPENDVKAMSKYASEHFAPYGGIAQQYLFYYITHK